MSTAIDTAIRRTGWEPAAIHYIYDEFILESDEPDFLEYVADYVGNAAFVIGASNGLPVEACVEAYHQGRESVIDEDFAIDEAIESIYESSDQE